MEYHVFLFFLIQGLLCQKTEFQTIIEMNNLPRWLTHQNLGNSISIELPPNWCNGRWMGFVLCAYVNVIGETFGLGVRVITLGDMPLKLSFGQQLWGATFGYCIFLVMIGSLLLGMVNAVRLRLCLRNMAQSRE